MPPTAVAAVYLWSNGFRGDLVKCVWYICAEQEQTLACRGGPV
jgi:hypothetical protein